MKNALMEAFRAGDSAEQALHQTVGEIINLQAPKFYCCHPEYILKVLRKGSKSTFSPSRRSTYRLERLLLSAVLESSAKSAERQTNLVNSIESIFRYKAIKFWLRYGFSVVTGLI